MQVNCAKHFSLLNINPKEIPVECTAYDSDLFLLIQSLNQIRDYNEALDCTFLCLCNTISI